MGPSFAPSPLRGGAFSFAKALEDKSEGSRRAREGGRFVID
jgi:hypothetical protein